ncbi:glycosyltransferase family 4 protein [Erysipelotrichaceae bacterium 66-17]
MKIFFANLNGLPPYSLSGAEITIDDFLSIFSKNGHEVLSVNCNEKWNFYHNNYKNIYNEEADIIQENENYTKYFFHSTESFRINIKRILERFEPDYIFSQLNFLEEFTEYCEICKKCRIIYFIHSNLTIGKNSNSHIDILLSNKVYKVICLSRYILSTLPYELQKKSEVVYPIFDKNKLCNPKENGEYILFFNPIAIKGVDIVIELSKIFKNEKFVIYETWNHITQAYKAKIEAQRNIILQNNLENYFEVYRDVKIYLLPSQCEEGFGRGIVEANISGIPIVASDIGGIKEASGKNQLLVHRFWDINEWEEKLQILLDDDNYKRYSKYGFENSKRFLCENKVKELLQIIKE